MDPTATGWYSKNEVEITPSPGVEASAVAGTALPLTAVPRILFRLHVVVVDVVHQLLKRVKEQVAL